MDSRVVPTQSQVNENNDEQNLQNVETPQPQGLTHGPPNENLSSDPEKKSVMNKMKAKARKIKDSIKKHGQQMLDHGNGNNNEDGVLEDKEMVQDTQDHQVPIYDSEYIKSTSTPTPESAKVENLGNSGNDFEDTKVMEEETYHDPLVEGGSSTTEINQNIDTDKSNPFAVEEKPDQFKGNLEKPIVLEEDSQEQGSKDAYTLPDYQTKDIDPSDTITRSDEIEDIKPLEESLERMNVHDVDDESKLTRELKLKPSIYDTENFGFGGTKATEEESYSDALVEGDSSTTEINQNIDTDTTKTKTFAVEEKPEQFKANLEKPIVLEEDSQEQGSRDAYSLPNDQTKDTDPSGTITRGDEIEDITPVEESLERIDVHDDDGPKLTREPNIKPSNADNEYSSSAAESQDIDQFVPQNEYSQETVSTDINRSKEFPSKTEETFDAVTDTIEQPDYDESLETQPKHKNYTDEIENSSANTDINRSKEIPSKTEETFNTVTDTIEQQDYEESVETQPKHKSYTDEIEISSANTDKTVPSENEEAFKLSNDKKYEEQNNENEKNIVLDNAAEVESEVESKGYGTNDAKNEDKGVTVKDYLAEKLRPSEEDKALSEVISEALHKGKEEPLEKDGGNLGSEDVKAEKVFEGSNVNSPGKGMVQRVKGVVGSWFGKSEENLSPQGGGIGEDISKNKSSVEEVEQVGKHE